MKKETTYNDFELKKGKCPSCDERSNEIVIEEGICAGCIFDQEFFDETMKNENKQANHRSPFGFM